MVQTKSVVFVHAWEKDFIQVRLLAVASSMSSVSWGAASDAARCAAWKTAREKSKARGNKKTPVTKKSPFRVKQDPIYLVIHQI